jgi:hypothetical protein
MADNKEDGETETLCEHVSGLMRQDARILGIAG